MSNHKKLNKEINENYNFQVLSFPTAQEIQESIKDKKVWDENLYKRIVSRWLKKVSDTLESRPLQNKFTITNPEGNLDAYHAFKEILKNKGWVLDLEKNVTTRKHEIKVTIHPKG